MSPPPEQTAERAWSSVSRAAQGSPGRKMGTRQVDKSEVIGDRGGCGMSLTKQVGMVRGG